MEESSEEKNKKLLAIQSENFSLKVKNLKETKCLKGRSAAVFQLRSDVVGSRNIASEPSAVKDHLTDQLVTTVDEIKRVSLSYCVNLLTNRPPKETYEEDLAMKNLLHEAHMNEKVDDDIF